MQPPAPARPVDTPVAPANNRAAIQAENIPPAVANQAANEASRSVNQALARFTDKTLVKGAWDLASKEWVPSGKLMVPITFPANLMRLPLINARKISELWFKK